MPLEEGESFQWHVADIDNNVQERAYKISMEVRALYLASEGSADQLTGPRVDRYAQGTARRALEDRCHLRIVRRYY
jgi:hypothetical protein